MSWMAALICAGNVGQAAMTFSSRVSFVAITHLSFFLMCSSETSCCFRRLYRANTGSNTVKPPGSGRVCPSRAPESPFHRLPERSASENRSSSHSLRPAHNLILKLIIGIGIQNRRTSSLRLAVVRAGWYSESAFIPHTERIVCRRMSGDRYSNIWQQKIDSKGDNPWLWNTNSSVNHVVNF